MIYAHLEARVLRLQAHDRGLELGYLLVPNQVEFAPLQDLPCHQRHFCHYLCVIEETDEDTHEAALAPLHDHILRDI